MENFKQKLKDLSSASEECMEEEKEDDRELQTEIEPLEKVFVMQGVEGIKRKLLETAETWRNTRINIAVTGKSGAGKSSFINAFLGISEDDVNAAKVGEVETSTELKLYCNPKHPNLKLWDMPGVGTLKHPRKTYLKEMNFDHYDFFMILAQQRFTEDDAWLAVEIQKRKKRFYFIRTNIDTDLSNSQRRTKKELDPEIVKSSVRENIRTNLEKAEVKDPKIFMIDNFDTSAHDFGEMERQLILDCDSVKKEALTLSLTNITNNVLYHKKDSLKKLSTDVAMAIACEADIRTQVSLYTQHLDLLAEQFGIDIETVMGNDRILSVTEENLETYMGLMVFIPVLTALNIPWLRNVSLKSRILRALGDKTKIPLYEKLFQFCCLAFEMNIDEMYNMALSMYDEKAQEAVVNTTLYSRK